jgi:hypothetical protein
MTWVVMVFELSHLISFLMHAVQNPHYFFNKGWNIFELINHIFWVTTFGLWINLWTTEKGGHHHLSPKVKSVGHHTLHSS